MAFDYSRLFGLMREKGLTQQALANEIRSTESTLSLKFNNKAKFKQDEISVICKILSIDKCEVGKYFFTEKV